MNIAVIEYEQPDGTIQLEWIEYETCIDLVAITAALPKGSKLLRIHPQCTSSPQLPNQD